jgi:hypothetical protein
MFNILSHKGNAYQNDTEISAHPSQNGYHQETTNAGEDVGEKNSYTQLVRL